MIHEFFILGSMVFWVFSFIFAIIMLAEVVHEKYGAAFVTFLIFCGIVFGFSNVSFSWFIEHQYYLLSLVSGYLVGAVVTSFVKWYFFVSDAKDRYNEFKYDYLRKNGVNDSDQIPDNLKKDYQNLIASHYNLKQTWDKNGHLNSTVKSYELIPNVRTNKERIIGWMAYWPFVVFWSLFNDVFRRILETMYKLVSKAYQNISYLIFKDIINDFNVPDDKKE